MENYKITGCVVLYNNSPVEIKKLMESISSVKNLSSLYAIDNSSSLELKVICQEYPFVEYIESENVGFGRAHNRGMNLSRDYGADYHLIINPDITFGTDVVNVMIDESSNFDNVGLVAPKVLYEDGSLQRLAKKVPSFFELLLSKIPIRILSDYFSGRIDLRGKYEYDKNMAFPFLSGCFLLCTKKVIENYRFDSRYWMYFEDLDFSRTIALKYDNYVVTEAVVTHGYRSEHKGNFKLFLALVKSYIQYFGKYGFLFDLNRKTLNKKLIEQL